MCGIVGAAGRRLQITGETVQRMRDTLSHRGPDDAGSWLSSDGTCALGHRRLSIIDLSPGGHQPMHDPKGELTIVFNGEIYYFLELRHELESRGHSFHTASDTEVILAAFREWGEGCVTRLRGMFSLAIHDSTRRTLFLARDRAGEKPMFYWHHDGVLLFGSELKALMQFPGFPRRLDMQALNRYLAFAYITGSNCILEGVKKLPAAHCATYDIDADTIAVGPYWRLPVPARDGTASDDDLVEEMHELLRDSVRHQLIADVPVGIMLSGGVDSSLVTAVASEVSSVPVHTFNISFPGAARYDEAPFARMVAKHFGTKHTELAAEPATVDLLPLLARQYDEPMGDSSMVPTYLVANLIRQEATVALGGDGGDELFGGYHHYEWVRRQELVRRLVPAPLRAGVSAAAKLLPLGVRGRNYLVGSARDLAWSMGHVNLYFDVRARRALLAPSGFSADDTPELEKARYAFGCSATQRAMAMDFSTYLADDILVKVDRASMLTSLEVRAPLLDPRIIEFAFGRVPDRLRAWRGQRKVLLRMLAKRLLPPELDITRKQGFSIPLDRWFEGPWGAYMRQVLSEADPRLFDQKVIQSFIAGQEKGLVNSHRLFALTVFELWRREYNVSL